MDWITDASDDRVKTALGWTCDICNARIKHVCRNTVQPAEPLPGRVIHYGRLIDRRLEK